MKTKFSLSLALVFAFLFSFAQDEEKKGYREYVLEGNYLLLEENYKLAMKSYQEAYKLDSNNALLNYNMGMCYLKILTEKSKAEYHFAKAIKKVDKNCRIDDALETSAPPLAHLHYGKALHLNYRFNEEMVQYDIFEKYVGTKDKEWKKILAKERETANYAKMMVNAPMNVKIENLGDSINSMYPEYSPVLSADERMLIFTTRRPTTTGAGKDDAGNYYEDVVVSYKENNGEWTKPVSISPNINGFGAEASVNLSADGQTLILYRDAGDGNNGNLYYSNFDGADWSPLKEFGSDVNSTYHESHACLSADGKVLIFASDRPGGYGGSDLYRCVMLPNGLWSKALNMGPEINTEYDEDGAFIHPDGKTFFFTSNGHNTIGGYDVMFSFLDENNKFSEVYNMGYPINTPDDDVFYVTSPDGKRGYFSSVKEGGYGEKDIYKISIPQAAEKPLVLFKGQILPAEGETLPADLMIVVKDKMTGEIVGTYRPKTNSGTFSTILPPGREYIFSYQAPQGYEFYSEDVFVVEDMSYTEINRAIALEPVQLLGKIKAKLDDIELKVVVLNNKADKEPIKDAMVIIQQVGGKEKNLVTNTSGTTKQLILAKE
ncbi:MAG: hypothetical protein AB7O73_13505, partial [Bacteroidia bacterium]